jgi:hypothetical protein
MKTMWGSLSLIACAFMLTATATAVEKSKVKADVPATKAATGKTVRTAWPSETLAGKIMLVIPAKNLVIVKGPDGVPFDLRVTPATRIESGDRKIALKSLNEDLQKGVSVRYVPERAGDIARTIQVTG